MIFTKRSKYLVVPVALFVLLAAGIIYYLYLAYISPTEETEIFPVQPAIAPQNISPSQTSADRFETFTFEETTPEEEVLVQERLKKAVLEEEVTLENRPTESGS